MERRVVKRLFYTFDVEMESNPFFLRRMCRIPNSVALCCVYFKIVETAARWYSEGPPILVDGHGLVQIDTERLFNQALAVRES